MSISCSSFPSPGPVRRTPPYITQGSTPECGLTLNGDPSYAVLLGESAAVRRMRAQVERIAPYFRTVLLRGEAGSGKRLVARALHRMSAGASGPFFSCPAATLADALAPGAPPEKAASLLDAASGGMLYLEEFGELAYPAQTSLVHLLTSRDGLRSPAFSSSHSPAPRPLSRAADLRIVAATDRDLRTLATIGQFRSDLYARIAIVEIGVPDVHQRAEDLPLLVGWILDSLSRTTASAPKTFSPAALDELASRRWPRNLRDLERTVLEAASRASGTIVEPWHMPATIQTGIEGSDRPDSPAQSARPDRLQDVIQQHVVDVLTRCGGNKLKAAEILGISRSTLYRMLDAGAACTVRDERRSLNHHPIAHS